MNTVRIRRRPRGRLRHVLELCHFFNGTYHAHRFTVHNRHGEVLLVRLMQRHTRASRGVCLLPISLPPGHSYATIPEAMGIPLWIATAEPELWFEVRSNLPLRDGDASLYLTERSR